MERFYVDTSIWRDYYEDRRDGIRPLGEFAFRFLLTCKAKRYKVLYSKWVVNELKNRYDKNKIKEIFSILSGLLEEVNLNNEQAKETKRLKNQLKSIPIADIIHAILARDNNAIVISRDKHFQELDFIAETRKPEDII
ncbi:MAG: PIN domain-containing protein [archaeon]